MNIWCIWAAHIFIHLPVQFIRLSVQSNACDCNTRLRDHSSIHECFHVFVCSPNSIYTTYVPVAYIVSGCWAWCMDSVYCLPNRMRAHIYDTTTAEQENWANACCGVESDLIRSTDLWPNVCVCVFVLVAWNKLITELNLCLTTGKIP